MGENELGRHALRAKMAEWIIFAATLELKSGA